MDFKKEINESSNWILEQDDDFITGYGQGNYALGLASLAWQAAKASVAECEWVADEDGIYHTTCQNSFVLNCDSPSENDMKFCCYCGGKLIEAQEQSK